MIAFHFPPMQGSSGMQRTLGFARHLPEFAWQCVVVTANAIAYPSTDDRQSQLIPDGLVVYRAMSFDARRHFSVAGRYPGFLAVPDRWISWIPFGVVCGLEAIRRYRPSIIWSTYPIASAHIIARYLSRLSGIPWVADFRDPMVEKNVRTGALVPENASLRRARLKIEQACVRHAASLIFCTEGARAICLERYPTIRPDISHVISNGFEEQLFQEVESRQVSGTKSNGDCVTILHSGTIYLTADRDPRPFFDAIAELEKEKFFDAHPMHFILRATGDDERIRRMLEERSIMQRIALVEPLPYIEAVTEMLSVDGLLLFQGYPSNPAIPAKLYEYLRAKRPILALVDAQGSTARLLRELETSVIASIESMSDIKNAVRRTYAEIASGSHPLPSGDVVNRFSRRTLAAEVAALFDGIVDPVQ
jgi:hypothetical protein